MSYGTVQAEKMTTESGYSLGAGNASSFKNRIINGAMDFDQRNVGGSVTVNTSGQAYAVDRFFCDRANGYSNTATAQRVSDAPAGFVRSLRYTAGTAETPTGAMYSNMSQYIEGTNIEDWGWGTANAKPAVLSFWVKISITGTFGVVLRSGNAGASYAISFTYSSANTWQYVTASIPGPTIGVFNTDNTVGFSVNWDLGVGPNLSISATGAWQATNALGLTSGTKLNATTGATYQLTGVQLEVGTVATSFDFRSVSTELALCQRYCMVFRGGTYGGFQVAGSVFSMNLSVPVPMRTTPSFSTTITDSNFVVAGPNANQWAMYVQNSGYSSYSGSINTLSLNSMATNSTQYSIGTYSCTLGTSFTGFLLGSNNNFTFNAEF